MRNIHRHHGRAAPERGVSLMETLVVIGVMMTIMVIISQIFLSTYAVYAKQTARIEADTGAVFAARTISEIARGAIEVVDSQTVNGTDYATSSTALILKLPTIDADGAIIAGLYDTVVFARDATDTDTIISDTDAATGSSRFDGQRVVTADNATMTFRLNAPDAADATRVSVLIINTVTTRGQTFTSPAWTSIVLRNK